MGECWFVFVPCLSLLCFVCARSVRLTLLALCSVFRVLVVCCSAFLGAPEADDLLILCHQCYPTCIYLVDVTETHTEISV